MEGFPFPAPLLGKSYWPTHIICKIFNLKFNFMKKLSILIKIAWAMFFVWAIMVFAKIANLFYDLFSMIKLENFSSDSSKIFLMVFGILSIGIFLSWFIYYIISHIKKRKNSGTKISKMILGEPFYLSLKYHSEQLFQISGEMYQVLKIPGGTTIFLKQ